MNALQAIKAYGAASAPVADIKSTAGGDFASMLKQVVSETQHATQTAESQMTLQAQGKAELIDAVTAVSSAQANLETVIAIRDQVINAYQEIMRMPI